MADEVVRVQWLTKEIRCRASIRVEGVLPHVVMFPIELLLPHLFCSLARGAKEACRTPGRHCERADVALGPRPSACKANRPVIGRGQGRQPPKAVAHRASLEHGRSPVYFTTVPSSSGGLSGDVTITSVCAAVSPEPNNSALACSLRHNLRRR